MISKCALRLLHITDEYMQALEDFTKLNDKLHDDYIARVERNITQNPAEFWKYVRGDQMKSSYPTQMTYNNETADTTNGKVNLFASYFESAYAPDDGPFDVETIYRYVPSSEIYEIDVTLFDVDRAVKKLKSNGSTGPDGLHPRIIRECADSLVFPIWVLLKMTLSTGNIPTVLKKS